MKTEVEIKSWIVNYLAEVLDMQPGDIDPERDFNDYGLNSSTAVSLMGDLEDVVDMELSPSILFKHNTINALARHLVAEQPAAVS